MKPKCLSGEAEDEPAQGDAERDEKHHAGPPAESGDELVRPAVVVGVGEIVVSPLDDHDILDGQGPEERAPKKETGLFPAQDLPAGPENQGEKQV